jgi:hypothetical protein
VHAFGVEELVGGRKQPIPGRLALRGFHSHRFSLPTGLSIHLEFCYYTDRSVDEIQNEAGQRQHRGERPCR